MLLKMKGAVKSQKGREKSKSPPEATAEKRIVTRPHSSVGRRTCASQSAPVCGPVQWRGAQAPRHSPDDATFQLLPDTHLARTSVSLLNYGQRLTSKKASLAQVTRSSLLPCTCHGLP